MEIIGYVILSRFTDQERSRQLKNMSDEARKVAEHLEPAWTLEHKHKVYRRKEFAEDAIAQMNKSEWTRAHWIYEVIPVYWEKDQRRFIG